MRVLDRFRPPWPRGEGSTPFHWILDEAGAHIVAQLLGIERRQLNWRHSTALAVARSSKLRHQLAINEFFARLAYEAAVVGGSFNEWYGERTAHTLFHGKKIMPDGYAVVGLPGREPLHVLLELDRATEPLDRLRDKATRYATELPHSHLQHLMPIVVLAVPTEARARAALKATAGSGAPITVTIWNADTSPLAVVTRP
jgi:Replication-relaxation